MGASFLRSNDGDLIVSDYKNLAVAFCAASLVIAFLSAPVSAQQRLQGPLWSPDGELITFGAFDGDWEIYTIRPNGRDLQQLTNNETGDLQPSFSQDGQRIIFTTTRWRAGDVVDWEIATIPTTGGEVEHLLGEVGLHEYNAFELQDGRIAFAQRRSGNGYDRDLRVWDPETDEYSYLSDEPVMEPFGLFEIRGSAPAEGDIFFFVSARSGHHEVFASTLDGSSISQITAFNRSNPAEGGWTGLGNASPSVSADGRYVAVWSDILAETPWGSITVFIIDRESGRIRHVERHQQESNMGYPGLSPDGSEIAFARAVGEGGDGDWALIVQDVVSGEERELYRTDLGD